MLACVWVICLSRVFMVGAGGTVQEEQLFNGPFHYARLIHIMLLRDYRRALLYEMGVLIL